MSTVVVGCPIAGFVFEQRAVFFGLFCVTNGADVLLNAEINASGFGYFGAVIPIVVFGYGIAASAGLGVLSVINLGPSAVSMLGRIAVGEGLGRSSAAVLTALVVYSSACAVSFGYEVLSINLFDEAVVGASDCNGQSNSFVPYIGRAVDMS